MAKQQACFLKIIGISASAAKARYDIEPIDTFIDQQCVTILERILKQPTHPITVLVTPPVTTGMTLRSKSRGAASSKAFGPPSAPPRRLYNIPKAHTSAYEESFLPRTIRLLRDGTLDMYTLI